MVSYLNITEPLKIEWVHDNFSGPVNGMVQYNGKSYWFCRTGLPGTLTSSVDIKIVREYSIIEVSNENIEKLNKIHAEYSRLTGSPLKHGDPIRSLDVQVNFNHGYDPNNVIGTVIGFVKETDFANFYVPNIVVL